MTPPSDPFSLSSATSLRTQVLMRLRQVMAACGIVAGTEDAGGPVYRLVQVQRPDERDRRHHPEFTLLHWRQPAFALEAMMTEAAAVTAWALGDDSGEPWQPEVRSCRDAWLARIGVDPLAADSPALRQAAQRLGLNDKLGEDRRAWLDLLFIRFIEPTLGYEIPLVLTDFPVELAGTARVSVDEEGRPIVRRFRLYVEGLALVSGQEDAEGGSSAGLGVERVMMVLADVRHIERVLESPGAGA